MPVCSAGPLADGSTQVPTSQRVDEQDDQENHLQQPRQCKHIHTLRELAKARKSSQHRPGFRLAAPASTATSGESSQLVSSPLVCWTPIRQHVTSPLVFDKHYHSLALHDKSVIQPLHHHHQQKSVLDFPREFWTLMRNDNPRVYIVCTSVVQYHHNYYQAPIRADVLNSAMIVVPHVTLISSHRMKCTNLRPLMCLKGF